MQQVSVKRSSVGRVIESGVCILATLPLDVRKGVTFLPELLRPLHVAAGGYAVPQGAAKPAIVRVMGCFPTGSLRRFVHRAAEPLPLIGLHFLLYPVSTTHIATALKAFG